MNTPDLSPGLRAGLGRALALERAECAPPEVRTVEVSCPLCESVRAQDVASGRDFEYQTSCQDYTFRRCLDCGVWYLSPRPEVSELARIYPESYSPYHFDEKRLTLRLRSWLEGRKVALLRSWAPGQADILDGGCGGAEFLDTLRRLGSPGWRLWGNDISPEVSRDLRERGFQVLPGRFEEIDAPAASFDVIVLKQVLEHLEQPRHVLAKAAELLRPGGRLLVETPNRLAWDGKLFGRRYWGGYHIPRHWTIFDPQTLAAAGEQVGLRVESQGFLLSPSFWVQSVHHYLLDRGWPANLQSLFSHHNPLAMGLAVGVDVLQKLLTGQTSNLRMVFRRPGADEPGGAQAA